MAKHDRSAASPHNDNDVVVTVSGYRLIVPQKFTEGHVLTAPEAAAFSAFFNTRVAGSAASNVERGKVLDGKTDDESRAWLLDYYGKYSFDEPRTMQTVGSVKRDLAADYVTERLTKQGKPVPTGDAMTSWVDKVMSDPGHGQNVASNFETWLATREKRVAKAKGEGAAVEVNLDTL